MNLHISPLLRSLPSGSVLRPRCPRCKTPRISLAPQPRFSSSSSRSQSSHALPIRRYLVFSLSLPLVLSPLLYFYPRKPSLSPQIYSEQPITSSKPLTPQHVLLTLPLPKSSIPLFEENAVSPQGEPIDSTAGQVVVQHMMIKSAALQIERPYTFINDPSEGEIRMIVKRNKGGEVGRLIHNLQDGEEIGIRGPIPTFALNPTKYDRIIMISTGTAISPFLQLLSKLSPSTSPSLHLIHAPPPTDRQDPLGPLNLLPSLEAKFGDQLKIDRCVPERKVLEDSLEIRQHGGNLLVLVCLPPVQPNTYMPRFRLMRSLCGPLTPTLDQGPILGLLKDLSLSSEEVLKLE
ncbi:hypothetical protein P7C73_g6285, partial [Tremellales sp. Uapishka_1]